MNPTDLDNLTTDPVDITVVVPVYNSSTCLEELLKRLTAQLESMGKSHEIILVEDCSSDNSWEVIEQLAPHYPNLRAFHLMRNSSQAKATLCGLAHGEIVFTMDDDLQHRPDQMPRLIEALEQDFTLDCVFGVFRQKKHSRHRNPGSRFFALDELQRVQPARQYAYFQLPGTSAIPGAGDDPIPNPNADDSGIDP